MGKIYRFVDILGKENDFLGKEIEIVNLSGDEEVYFNENMRCKIVGFVRHDWEDEKNKNLEIKLDFKPFEEFNKTKMFPDFFDAKGIPSLTWIETSYYKDGKDSFIIMAHNPSFSGRDDSNTFKLISDIPSTLMEAYEKSGETSYVEFLEKLAIKSL